MGKVELPIFRRGDIVRCGFEGEVIGRVVSDLHAQDNFFRVRWEADGGRYEDIDRENEPGREGVIILNSRDTIYRVSSCNDMIPGTTQTALEQLETLEALDRVRDRMETLERSITNRHEQLHWDALVRRCFAPSPECDFDRKHKAQLQLLLMGSPVGPWFRVLECLHRPIHDLHHRSKSR